MYHLFYIISTANARPHTRWVSMFYGDFP